MSFCENCGQKNSDTARFCECCGTRLPVREEKKPEQSGGLMGDRNVIAGDVSHTVTNTTTYINADDGKTTVVCHICGKLLTKGSGQVYRCGSCGEFVCSDHIDHEQHKCPKCIEKDAFAARMNEFLPFEYEQLGTGKFVITKLRDRAAMEVKVPDMVESIGPKAFAGSNVFRVTLPEGLLAIGQEAFMDCKQLKQINLPSSLCLIADRAFYGCERLELTLRQGIEVGEDILFGTLTYRKAEEAVRRAEEEARRRAEEAARRAEEEAKRRAEEAKRRAEEAAIRAAEEAKRKAEEEARRKAEEEARRKAEEEAKRRAAEKAKIQAAEEAQRKLLEQKRRVEEESKRKAEEEFRRTWEISGDKLIKYKGNDENVVIPDGIRIIETNAFAKCKLKNLTIPPSVEIINSFAFSGSIESIHISDWAAWCNMGIDRNPLECGAKLYLNRKLQTDVRIPQGISTLKRTFQGYKDLTSVELPNTLESISYGAFWRCEKLTEVVIPEGVTEIGKEAFRYCSQLKKVTMPATVKRVESSAFAGCPELTIHFAGTKKAFAKANSVGSGISRVVCSDGTLELKPQTADEWINKQKVALAVSMSVSLAAILLLGVLAMLLTSFGTVAGIVSAVLCSIWLIFSYSWFTRNWTSDQLKDYLDNKKMRKYFCTCGTTMDIASEVLMLAFFGLSLFYPEKFTVGAIAMGVVCTFNALGFGKDADYENIYETFNTRRIDKEWAWINALMLAGGLATTLAAWWGGTAWLAKLILWAALVLVNVINCVIMLAKDRTGLRYRALDRQAVLFIISMFLLPILLTVGYALVW